MTHGPLLAYQFLVRPEDSAGIQRALSGTFRTNLIRESGLQHYAIDDPREVLEPDRTERWEHLCSLTETFDQIPIDDRIRTARLWVDLGFHALAIRKIPRYGHLHFDESSSFMNLLGLRAFAEFMLLQGEPSRFSPIDFECILSYSDKPSRARYEAANALLVYHAKVTRDVSIVRECRQIMTDYVNHIIAAVDEFSAQSELSRYYRAVSFLPWLEGSRKQVVREMELAEQIARDLPRLARTETQRVIARENLHPILESRMREAIWLGDLDLALQRVKELVNEVDPWDAKARVELGEVLWQRCQFCEAAVEFLTAAHLGPPGTVIAWYLAGQCYERLGEWERACNAYVSALKLDPDGLSSTEGLLRAASRAGSKLLSAWAYQNALRLGQPLPTCENPQAALALPLPGPRRRKANE